MTTLDEDLQNILQRAAANLPATPPPPPPPADDRSARRIRALIAIGWERRALNLASGPDYDVGRAIGYLDAMHAIDTVEGGIAVLAGNPGAGKTAAAARWAITRQRNAPRFLRAAEFFRWSRYDGKGEEAGRRDALLREPALVLDDAGAEYADQGGSYRVDLDELIDRFYSDNRVLVITTNMIYGTPAQRDAAKKADPSVDESLPTFVERYGERVTDRIRECGKWVSSAAKSMRRRAP